MMFRLRTDIRRCVLGAVPPLRCGPLRAGMQVASGQLCLRLRFRPCRPSFRAGASILDRWARIPAPQARQGRLAARSDAAVRSR